MTRLGPSTPSTDAATPYRPISLSAAKAICGLSFSTLRRRIDAWAAGERDDYALRGGRAGTKRYADEMDVILLAKQLCGELGAGRHARATCPEHIDTRISCGDGEPRGGVPGVQA